MQRRILVANDPHETRIAVFEDGRLAELHLEREHDRGIVGNIYRGRVRRVLPGMQAAFVDIGLDRDAFLYVDQVVPRVETPEAEDLEPVSPPPIQDLLRTGQELVVQVVKDGGANKGARITTHLSLPGRFLVFLEGTPQVGVSRRISDESERERLRAVAEELCPDGAGLIVRTAGAEVESEELAADLAHLVELRDRLIRRSERVRAPTLLHRELDLALRVVRDEMASDVDVLWVEGEEVWARLVEFLETFQSELVDRLRLWDEEESLMRRFGVEREIEAALDRRVPLPSGGDLVIHQTEALVAIDVNTGRYVGRDDVEETLYRTNLEAVAEIVRQIRLRNLGGIIVVDLIDMSDEEHRAAVSQAFETALERDRARHRMLGLSEFGLVEITRKRTGPSLESMLTRPCPHCRGTGRLKGLATVCLEIRRRLLEDRDHWRRSDVVLRVHPEVARALQREEASVLRELEQRLGVAVLVQGDTALHPDIFEIVDT